MASMNDKETNNEKLGAAAAGLLDSMEDPLKAQKILIFCGFIDSTLFGLSAMFHSFVNDFQTNTKIYLSFILFGIGFYATFGLVKLLNLGEKQITTRSNEFMSGYANISEKNRQWKFWLLSTALGFVNVILYFVMIQLFVEGTVKFPF